MATEAHTTAGPYLSVVVTSRNDGHGGDPLARLQAFINTFDAQCRRFGLDAELVVVEWNPPPDRPRVHELVRLPAGCSFTMRFIEVPPALHRGLPNAHVLPLFQMIGKNVGVRRARGRFVLSTNIDIIFSNDLVAFFASRALRAGVLYRVDRHDIESNYPINGTLEEQTAYCATHQLRIHRSFGTFPVDSRGRLVMLNPDVFAPPAVTIGDGWHVREGDPSLGFYRWATDAASLVVDAGSGADAALMLDVEPNPYDPASWVGFDVVDDAQILARARITDRQRLRVPLPPAEGPRTIVLRTTATSPLRERSLPAFERRTELHYRLRSAVVDRLPAPLAAMRRFDMSRWRDAHRDVRSERRADGIVVRSAPASQSYCLRYGPLHAPRAGRFLFAVDCSMLEGNVSLRVVDEASDRWIPAHEYETADGDRRRLFVSAELTAGRAYSLYIANRFRGGDGVSRFVVHDLSGSASPEEFDFRIGASGLLARARLVAAKVIRKAMRAVHDVPAFKKPVAPGEVRRERVTSQAPPEHPLTARIEEYAAEHRPAVVHRNAAGDFQLMARENWSAVHGFAEFTMYSMNIDGLLGDVAHYAGIAEEVLEMPRCIYHLEHAEGSGWTPEGEGLLRKRLRDSGADWLDASTVDLWSAYMDWLKRPMLFNGPDWGFGSEVLPETTLSAGRSPV